MPIILEISTTLNPAEKLTDFAAYAEILCGRHLHKDFDVAADARLQQVRRRPLHQLPIAQRGQLKREILQPVAGPIDHQQVEHDVGLVEVHVRLDVHRIVCVRQRHDH